MNVYYQFLLFIAVITDCCTGSLNGKRKIQVVACLCIDGAVRILMMLLTTGKEWDLWMLCAKGVLKEKTEMHVQKCSHDKNSVWH